MHDASFQHQLHALRQQVVVLAEALEQSRRENTILRQKLDALTRRFFGKKSEQLDAVQLELLLSGWSQGAEPTAAEEEPPVRPTIAWPRPDCWRSY